MGLVASLLWAASSSSCSCVQLCGADLSPPTDGSTRLLSCTQAADLFVPCSDNRLLRIDLSNNTVAQEYKGHSDWVLTACYQPTTTGDDNRRYIASGSFDGEVRIWNIADAAIVRHWIAKP